MLVLADALSHQRPCPCGCHTNLTVVERLRAIRALYKLDDALRGMGYVPNYELHGDALFRAAQARNDTASRVVAVRFGECIYRRLVGSMLHEVLHALCGDPTAVNYGIPMGLPYGVPEGLPEAEEAEYVATFNVGEARAFAGVWILAKHLFQIAWEVRTARDVGTYCFVGGNALVKVPKGFRAVAHLDRTDHAERYYAKARAIEDDARAWFTKDRLVELGQRIEAYAREGEKKRPRAFADPNAVVAKVPEKIGRNDPCVCGSPKKYKACCGGRSPTDGTPYFEPTSVTRG
jgi:hypothetical protein